MTLTQQVTEESPTHQIKSHKREINNSRLDELSQPKHSKSTWITSFGPRLIWGNQDTMWPVSKAALKHVPSPRLKTLAKPKNDFLRKDIFIPQFQYSCGRESSIWPTPPSTRGSPCTERMNFLAQPKLMPASYINQHRQNCNTSCGRVSPIWRPTKSALNCQSRPRTCQLARPKTVHTLYKPPRHVITVVPDSAKHYISTAEIDTLARPKSRPDGPFRDPQWLVTPGAKQAEASQRQVELARPKRMAEGYEASKEIMWPVTTGAKHAVPSSRLSELSKPIVRATMDHVQFNPDAFQVSKAATKATATPRLEELAQPIQRKT